MNKLYKTLARYCEETIWEYEDRVQLALRKMDRERAPLSMVDRSLYNEIMDAVDEWGADNEVDVEDVDIEELIFVC